MTDVVDEIGRRSQRVSQAEARSLPAANVLLLGVGGVHGSEYKLGLVKRLREATAQLVVVGETMHWADACLREQLRVDGMILLSPGVRPPDGLPDVMRGLADLRFCADAVVT